MSPQLSFLYGLLRSVLLRFIIGEYRSIAMRVSMLASGIIVVLANYVRPVAILFIVPVVAYMFIRRFEWRSMTSYAAGISLMMLSISIFNYHLNGHAIAAASTSGVNMIIGASDQANGSFEGSVFGEENAGYIPDDAGLDAFEKDSVWMHEAVSWIAGHPADYIALMPEKVFRLWCSDDYSDMSLDPKYIPGDKSGRTAMIVRIVSRSAFYYAVLVLSLFGLFAFGRRLWGVSGLPLIPLVGACCIHALMYGAVRYHYPYVPILIFYASVGLIFLVGKIQKKKIC